MQSNREAVADDETSQSESAARIVKTPTLGMDLDTYVRNFNTMGGRLSTPLQAHVGSLEKGRDKDVVQIRVDDLSNIVLALESGTQEVSDVTFIGVGDGSTESGAHILLGSIAALQAGVGESEHDAVMAAIKRMILNAKYDGGTVHETVGNKKLFMSMSSVTGLMVGIEPARQ